MTPKPTINLQEAPSTETPRRDLCPHRNAYSFALVCLPLAGSLHSKSSSPPLSYKLLSDNRDNAALSPFLTCPFLPPRGKVP